ncbi:MAG: glycosyltransferase family 4 protein [Verrucomicrobiota bacterium]
MKPPRLAFICPRFAEGGTVGGAETLLRSLADRAAAKGHEVTFLTTCATDHFTWENTLPPGPKKVGDITVEFFPVDDDRDVGTFLQIQTAISNNGRFTDEDERIWIDNSVNSRALTDHLKQHGDRYDRIVTGPYLFGLVFHAARIHPKKTFLVPCLHDEAFAYLKIMRELFDPVAGFLFNTEPERDLARSIFELSENRCSVVGMGLDPFDADPGAFAKRHSLTQPYVLYCGRREPLKGTPILLDYMKAFRERTGRDVKLVFTGSGPINPPPDLEPHILDVGFVSESEKHEAMAGAVAFIHPSVNESLGIVLLESWLARTPALVHDKCEVLKWQCRSSRGGLWFRNYPDFEEELLLLLDQPELNRQLGEAGRDYVLKQYAWDEVSRRFIEALD